MKTKTHILALAIIAIPLACLLTDAFAVESSPTPALPKIVIPDADYLTKLCKEMVREERGSTHPARDKIVAYVKDLSKPDSSRELCVNFVGSVKSEEGLKILASLLSDQSPGVRTRAFYGLPKEVQSKITDFDYTAAPTPKEFPPILEKIDRLIEDYYREKRKTKA